MDRPDVAARRPSPRVLIAGALGLAATIALVGSMVIAARPVPLAAVASEEPTRRPTARPTATPTPRPTPSPSATPSPTPTPPAVDPLLGTDGRLTVLLLGSDARPSHPGNRTDVVMVVSVDPTTGAVAAASIPRDTVNFPTSSRRLHTAKINGLYQSLVGQVGRNEAGREMKRIIGSGIGVEVDSYAVVGFEGVRQLVNAVGGVDVRLAKPVNDPYYWVTSTKRGVHFPAGLNHLNGERALIFARTRKGDNDFERARRQQLLVAAAVDAVRERGPASLPKLLSIADRYVRTDLPIASAPELFRIIAAARTGDATRIVFGPSKWASAAGGSSYTLKLDVVRQWTATYMAPAAD